MRLLPTIGAVAVFGACAGAALSSAQESSSPVELYVKMRATVNTLPVPEYVAFTLQDASTRKNLVLRERLRIVVRSSDGHAWVRMLENAAGDAVLSPPQVITTPVYPGVFIERPGDFPLADFGLRPRRGGRSGLFEASGTPEPEPSMRADGAQSIGSVRTYNLSYEIVDMGDTTIGKAPVRHLRLTPRRDPGHNVLREVWIDESTFTPRRYVAERFVESGPIAFRYLITVDTALIDGHLVNVAAEGHFDVHRALIINYSGEGRWSISDVTFPTDLPPWLFDPDRYKDHLGDPVPSL